MTNVYRFRQWSLTVLRLVIAVIFIYHGYLKLFAPGGLLGTANFFASIGIPLAKYAAILVGFVEFAGGLFLLLGFVTKWASLVLIIEMLVAIFKAHLRNGFLIANNGYEFALLIGLCLLVLLLNGPGSMALDRLIFESEEEEQKPKSRPQKKVNVKYINGSGVIAKTGIKREEGYLYFIDKKGDVSRVQMARRGKRTSKKHELILKVGLKRKEGYLYYIDKKGDIAQSKMARG